jgi:hypothetical protein
LVTRALAYGKFLAGSLLEALEETEAVEFLDLLVGASWMAGHPSAYPAFAYFALASRCKAFAFA